LTALGKPIRRGKCSCTYTRVMISKWSNTTMVKQKNHHGHRRNQVKPTDSSMHRGTNGRTIAVAIKNRCLLCCTRWLFTPDTWLAHRLMLAHICPGITPPASGTGFAPIFVRIVSFNLSTQKHSMVCTPQVGRVQGVVSSVWPR